MLKSKCQTMLFKYEFDICQQSFQHCNTGDIAPEGFKYCNKDVLTIFLAVQNSSIGDPVPCLVLCLGTTNN